MKNTMEQKINVSLQFICIAIICLIILFSGGFLIIVIFIDAITENIIQLWIVLTCVIILYIFLFCSTFICLCNHCSVFIYTITETESEHGNIYKDFISKYIYPTIDRTIYIV